ncbi:tyrosine-protein phosphatase non-receptor type 1 isoform X2 [Octopus bimaculoides]|uniref:protein-tyrosine-phosphatase n=1 Tax=Octopus bimaculoides TaxID=37653 RepID=A0A0L8FHP6_OCTBM|nr:tyrosine-protein phosphatase non-receptor type 1 isoform X2 [Octopus bimaculoides]|eukprot:XP_014789898.1 PREDICTED: tyrosine-protein phosphatase non-receptor type 1-like isoform X2 [Octopus bimaculoides]
MSTSVERQFKEHDQNGLWNGVFKKLKKAEDLSVIDSRLTTLEARKPENRNKNRYRDVNPYDHSRIILDVNNGCGDYINANLIEISKANRRYILTQGPLENTVGQFWQMVWEQNTMGIVMLNRIMEKGTVKCHQYWPPGSKHGYDEDLTFSDSGFKVVLLKEEENEHYIVRSLKLWNLNTDESRNVLHFQYTTWPDFGVPSSPHTFLNFLMAVRESGYLNNNVGPCIVHCSAGIGRSGTFCLVDSALVIVEKDWNMEVIDVESMLQDMRYYRMGLVQTPDQLRFSFLSIIDGGKQILSNPPPIKENEIDTNCEMPPMPPKRTTSLMPGDEFGNDLISENADSKNTSSFLTTNGDLAQSLSATDHLTSNHLSSSVPSQKSQSDTTTTSTTTISTTTTTTTNPTVYKEKGHPNESEPQQNNITAQLSSSSSSPQAPLSHNGQTVEYLLSVGSSTDPVNVATTGESDVDGYEYRRKIREERKRNTQKLIEDMKRKQRECELMRQRNRYLTPLYIGIVLALGGSLLLYRYYNNGNQQ